MADPLDRAELAVSVAAGLRAGGLPADPVRTARFADHLGLLARDPRSVYLAARTTFASSPEELVLFDRLYMGLDAGLTASAAPDTAARAIRSEPQQAPVAPRTGSPDSADGEGALTTRPPTSGEVSGEQARQGRAPGVGADANERLRHAGFATLDSASIRDVRRLMREAALSIPERRSHRYRGGARRGSFDARGTLRRAARTAGEPSRIMWRARTDVPRQLVILCDVSGSMRPFAPVYLQLMQAAAAGAHAETFLFGTRLTRVTRQLRDRHPDAALQRAIGATPDWSGGTRIVDALRTFNHRWGQRGMARGAVVVIFSDGRDSAREQDVHREMRRLGNLAHRIIWVNPRWPGSGMGALVGNMAAALPFCDVVLSGHTLAALDDVLEAISG